MPMTFLFSYTDHNGSVNFSKMKNDGIAGVIIRAGYGQGNTDKKFKSYIEDALDANLPVGIYWFSYAYTASMAKKEAEYCYKLIKNYKITLPVFLIGNMIANGMPKSMGYVLPNR